MERLRIDKWLWGARFYKTRSLASDEIALGRVRIHGNAVKPAHEVKPGDVIELRIGNLRRTVQVLALSDKRGPAPVAALLYQETEASVLLREQLAQQLRLTPEPALSRSQGRPTKRDRRVAEQLRQQHGWDDRWSAF
ncbi:MAG: RNA-binding protein [Comamonadaceae bacterium CG1_02_60_18]|nr:MAG: RNA-binding protein [Comamonadaceae bacterium CG1_02_60_18]PIQ52233.1 MAG: RNA-binding protein [Comamonadaceae bacterium CG12_big_fil_rev_8_21_14_0_65_59_15]